MARSLVQDCPKGFRATVRRQLVGVGCRVGAAVLFLTGLVGGAQLLTSDRSGAGGQVAWPVKIRQWFNPPSRSVIMGEIINPGLIILRPGVVPADNLGQL